MSDKDSNYCASEQQNAASEEENATQAQELPIKRKRRPAGTSKKNNDKVKKKARENQSAQSSSNVITSPREDSPMEVESSDEAPQAPPKDLNQVALTILQGTVLLEKLLCEKEQAMANREAAGLARDKERTAQVAHEQKVAEEKRRTVELEKELLTEKRLLVEAEVMASRAALEKQRMDLEEKRSPLQPFNGYPGQMTYQLPSQIYHSPLMGFAAQPGYSPQGFSTPQSHGFLPPQPHGFSPQSHGFPPPQPQGAAPQSHGFSPPQPQANSSPLPQGILPALLQESSSLEQ